MGSLAAHPGHGTIPTAASPFERRLRAEWDLLSHLVVLNPGRLTRLAAEDTTFFVTLNDTPAMPLSKGAAMLCEHRLRVVFPRYFPSLPLELSLVTPVFHPNVHPLTGFVCLWDQHRVSNTVEHALHKTVAILGWKLLNFDPRHTMQPETLALSNAEREALVDKLVAPMLRGVAAEVSEPERPSCARRIRLASW